MKACRNTEEGIILSCFIRITVMRAMLSVRLSFMPSPVREAVNTALTVRQQAKRSHITPIHYALPYGNEAGIDMFTPVRRWVSAAY